MKTLIPLTVASIALAVSFSVFAADSVLSPRAKDTQMKSVTASDTSPNTVIQHRSATASPRQLDMRGTRAPGISSSPSTIAAGCALGSPKQLEQSGKFNSGNCCQVTSVACTRPKACCSGK